MNSGYLFCVARRLTVLMIAFGIKCLESLLGRISSIRFAIQSSNSQKMITKAKKGEMTNID